MFYWYSMSFKKHATWLFERTLSVKSWTIRDLASQETVVFVSTDKPSPRPMVRLFFYNSTRSRRVWEERWVWFILDFPMQIRKTPGLDQCGLAEGDVRRWSQDKFFDPGPLSSYWRGRRGVQLPAGQKEKLCVCQTTGGGGGDSLGWQKLSLAIFLGLLLQHWRRELSRTWSRWFCILRASAWWLCSYHICRWPSLGKGERIL